MHLIQCEKNDAVLEMLRDVGEKLEWVAKTDLHQNISVTMWHSDKNNTYTIVLTQKEHSCVLLTGSQRNFVTTTKTKRPNDM